MRTISVYLNDAAEQCLLHLMRENNCTISDAVTISLMAVAQETQPLFSKSVTLWDTVKRKVLEECRVDIQTFCDIHQVNLPSLRHLCYRLERGSTVRGFGGRNKWRDKQDGREYKTHTAYATACLKQHTGLDLEEYCAD